ncbi:MAG: hypothetical protein LBM75_09780 [Myxococcales bacterium]|nr:hypothetical protein [Myxococcales bacterium]
MTFESNDDSNRKRRIIEYRVNQTTSVILHEGRIENLERTNFWVEFLSVSVPIAFLTTQSIEDAFLRKYLNIAGSIMSVVLIIATIASKHYGLQDRLKRHERLILEGHDFINDAIALELRPEIDQKDFERLLERKKRLDFDDSRALSNLSTAEKQKAFREVLKEEYSIEAVCPDEKCGISLWRGKPSKKGCPVCGLIQPNSSKE